MSLCRTRADSTCRRSDRSKTNKSSSSEQGVSLMPTVYRDNDWIAYNGIPYLASRNIAAGNPPNGTIPPTGGQGSAIPSLKACPIYKAFKDDPGVYPFSDNSPPRRLRTWDGNTLNVSAAVGTETIPSGTGNAMAFRR